MPIDSIADAYQPTGFSRRVRLPSSVSLRTNYISEKIFRWRYRSQLAIYIHHTVHQDIQSNINTSQFDLTKQNRLSKNKILCSGCGSKHCCNNAAIANKEFDGMLKYNNSGEADIS